MDLFMLDQPSTMWTLKRGFSVELALVFLSSRLDILRAHHQHVQGAVRKTSHLRQCGKISIHRTSQRRQLGGQHLVVPRGELARAVVGQPVSSRLCGRQVGHMNGYGFEAQLSRRLQSSVPDDDRAIGIDHDGLPESVLPDGRGNGIHRRFRNAARVVFVGFESVQGALLDQQRS